MKTFEQYQDGDLVTYKGSFEVYVAYKSQYTHNAFRLKAVGGKDVIADISEIAPFVKQEQNEKPNSNIQRDFKHPRYSGYQDSDADATGIYHLNEDSDCLPF